MTLLSASGGRTQWRVASASVLRLVPLRDLLRDIGVQRVEGAHRRVERGVLLPHARLDQREAVVQAVLVLAVGGLLALQRRGLGRERAGRADGRVDEACQASREARAAV